MAVEAPFRLGTFRRAAGRPFVGLEVDGEVLAVQEALTVLPDGVRGRCTALMDKDGMRALLGAWDACFPALQALAEFVRGETPASERFAATACDMAALAVLPPVPDPGKMLYAGANAAGHVREMRAANFTGGAFDASRDFLTRKQSAQPYVFLKATSCLAGAYDDIELPPEWSRIDWEAELALAIGPKAKRVPAERALEHVAGFMTANDVSCRDLTFRDDRPTLRSDWLGGKSHDTFAPMGPFLVPRAFVPDHRNLAIRLWVNGAVKQDGTSAEFMYGPEELIEYCSRILTLHPGDIISCGTVTGVGQASGQFLKSGDVVETEVEGLGRQRNRCVAWAAA